MLPLKCSKIAVFIQKLARYTGFHHFTFIQDDYLPGRLYRGRTMCYNDNRPVFMVGKLCYGITDSLFVFRVEG